MALNCESIVITIWLDPNNLHRLWPFMLLIHVCMYVCMFVCSLLILNILLTDYFHAHMWPSTNQYGNKGGVIIIKRKNLAKQPLINDHLINLGDIKNVTFTNKYANCLIKQAITVVLYVCWTYWTICFSIQGPCNIAKYVICCCVY